VFAAACGFALFMAFGQRGGAEATPPASAGLPISAADQVAPLAAQPDQAGPEPSAFGRAARPSDAPIADVPWLAKDARLIARVSSGGVERSLYVGKNGSGSTCLMIQEGAKGRGGGGCNSSRNPFLGSTVLWSSDSYNESPQKFVFYGVVTKRVAAVSLTFANGSTTSVPLSADDGFVYAVTKPTIEASDVPQAIETFDSKGRLIERTELGITFGA